ncbi:MAG TPA: thiamine phosphate synthase [Vicinamibacteria bacterium]|nr:thiamine phosphate synthase [Vicinamibacteria bacterium]
MLVSDRGRQGSRGLPARAAEAAAAGLDWVQVRERDLPDAALLLLVQDVQAAVAGSATRVLVNGRPDVAVAAGAAGVQLPEEGLPVHEVRRAFPTLVVGASCHSLAAARRAEEGGADFIVLGPVFPTPGKEGRSLGVRGLSEVVRSSRVAVYAIGGMDVSSAPRAVAAGAGGLAAIRLFLDPPEPLPRLVARLKALSAS